MNEFIHTFSIKRLLSGKERDSLLSKDSPLSFCNSTDKTQVLKDHTHSGLRAEITRLENDSPQRMFDSKHPQYEIEIIVTPAKMLNPSMNLGGIISRKEIEDACKKLSEIIWDIEQASGVDLLQEAKLYRVDLTKDIITPNDFCTHEIIKAARKAINRYGYETYDPKAHADYKIDWKQEDSMLFKSKKVWGKLYNKKRDLVLHKCQSEIEELGDYGLLRFEISLLRSILRDDYSARGYISLDVLPEILYQITTDGNSLLNKHLVNTFYDGTMLSRSVLKKYLNKKSKSSKAAKSMINFSDWIRRTEPKDLKCYDTPHRITTQIKRFAELKISPVQINKECPYIPSFSDMLNETVDDKLRFFAWRSTERHHNELTYWYFG